MNELSIKLKAQAEAKFEQTVTLKTLEERIEQNLLVAHNGGLFKATPELMSFLATWPDEVVYLKDEYQRPVELNTQEILHKLQQVYRSVMNEWHLEYSKLVRVRKIENV